MTMLRIRYWLLNIAIELICVLADFDVTAKFAAQVLPYFIYQMHSYQIDKYLKTHPIGSIEFFFRKMGYDCAYHEGGAVKVFTHPTMPYLGKITLRRINKEAPDGLS